MVSLTHSLSLCFNAKPPLSHEELALLRLPSAPSVVAEDCPLWHEFPEVYPHTTVTPEANACHGMGPFHLFKPASNLRRLCTGLLQSLQKLCSVNFMGTVARLSRFNHLLLKNSSTVHQSCMADTNIELGNLAFMRHIQLVDGALMKQLHFVNSKLERPNLINGRLYT